MQVTEFIKFYWPLLDPGGLGGYLHRLAMVGPLRHNSSTRPATMFAMGKDLPTTTALISSGDPRFPSRLWDLPRPPRALWAIGRAPAEDTRLIAVVGSRAATGRAVRRASALAAELAATGWGVISGGALGIDAAAHAGALEAGGPTFAVLGCGIDVVYPDRHARLFDDIVTGGGALLSEYGPGTPPRRGQFPARNRLVAALAGAVVVGESRQGSGALITARLGLSLGRPLFAMAGSAGTDALLASGAALPVESAGDILRGLGEKAEPVSDREPPAAVAGLLAALADGPATAEMISRRLGLPLGEVLGALSEAELDGFVVRVAGSRFEARFGAGFAERLEVPRGH